VGDKIPGVGSPFIINIGISFERSIPIDDSVGIIGWSYIKTFHSNNKRKWLKTGYLGRGIFQCIELYLIAWLFKVQACTEKEGETKE